MAYYLDQHAVKRSHEGVEFRFRKLERGTASTTLMNAAFSWILFGPLTVVALALPGAMIVEAMGWWLVNETLLMWRWGLIGFGFWIPLVLLTWGLLQSGRSSLWIGQHSVAWRNKVGVWRELPYAEVSDVWTEVGRLVIRDQRERVYGIAIEDGVEAVHATGLLLAQTWRAAEAGTAKQIPAGLRALLAQQTTAR